MPLTRLLVVGRPIFDRNLPHKEDIEVGVVDEYNFKSWINVHFSKVNFSVWAMFG